MSEDEIREIQRALRDMASQLGSLTSTVTHLTTQWERQDNAATAGRRVLHRKLDELSDEVGQLSAQVDAAAKEIDDMQPTVALARQAFSDLKTASRFVKFAYGVAGSLTTGAGLVVLHHFFGK